MIYRILGRIQIDALRRFLAALFILLLPVLAVLSTAVGVALYVRDFIKDGYQLLRYAIPTVAVELFRTVKTGKAP